MRMDGTYMYASIMYTWSCDNTQRAVMPSLCALNLENC